MSRRYVQKSDDGKWGATKDGELWRLGRYGYMAGYISRPRDRGSLEAGVFAAEEEARILTEQARREFA